MKCIVSWCESPQKPSKAGFCGVHNACRYRGHDPEHYVRKIDVTGGRAEDANELHGLGVPIGVIAERLRVCRRTIERDLKRYREMTA